MELTHGVPEDHYPEDVEEPTTFLPPHCQCVLVLAGSGAVTRIPHQNCPVPAADHPDDWKDTL